MYVKVIVLEHAKERELRVALYYSLGYVWSLRVRYAFAFTKHEAVTLI